MIDLTGLEYFFIALFLLGTTAVWTVMVYGGLKIITEIGKLFGGKVSKNSSDLWEKSKSTTGIITVASICLLISAISLKRERKYNYI